MRKSIARKILQQRMSVVRRSTVALAVAACFSGTLALANPTNPTVVHGAASFAQAGSILNITNSPNAIINWGSFSIGVNELTRFLQQSSASAVLNRVIGQDPSAILGALQSNGKVFLLNPNGIVFGAGSQINVAGLVASTLNLSNDDFLNNRMRFTDGAGAGSVVNQGNLTGGSIYLVGKAVTNNGIITSPQGEVILAAGNSVELVNPGTPNLRVEIVAPDNEARNLGTITADAGRIGIYAGLIKQSGTIRADSVTSEGGRILLKATKFANLDAGSVTSASGATGGSVDVQADVFINTGSIHADGAQGGGSVAVEARNVLSAGRISADGAQGAGGEVNVQASGRILQTSAAHLSANSATSGGKVTLQAADRVFGSGALTATGQGAGSTGGEIKVLGNDIVLLGARLDASGDAGGGSVLVGGDFQGNNPAVQNATTNQINFSTTINVDARTTGNGGKVIVWSDQETKFYGTISARGGATSGDGGFIEVSGKENLVFGGMADAGAPNGKPGTLLLDPKFIVIDSAGGGGGLTSFLLVDPNPGINDQFAQQVIVLPNDNVVATDPNDDFAATNAGAVYLFNGTTGALISTLSGSTADNSVGSGGVVALAGNGNYVVVSPNWDGAAADVGTVTWGNGTTGISGAVSSSNSLVGTTAGDNVGNLGVTALTNGNYVVSSPNWTGAAAAVGAVTWGNGLGGTVGAVTALNSLVGSTLNDKVGNGSGGGGGSGVTALTNGNYVVRSPFWDGAAADAGAVTWGDGSTAGPRLVGTVSATNSLVGTTAGDFVGITDSNISGITALSNGNYVVISPFWNGQSGAATWGNGLGGTVGAVTALNSLVGQGVGSRVGGGGAVALAGNGNYVVISPQWDNVGAQDAGAVTWGDGSTAGTRLVGQVSAANSLVGTTAFDQLASTGVGGSFTALSNGNYVVGSPVWGASNVGAVTWVNGTNGHIAGSASPGGAVTALNSLVGSTLDDNVGQVTALTNGNYVVGSSGWGASNVGAVTWGNGLGGTVGAVSAANSLVGTTANDFVGGGGVRALSNGNYVVISQGWDGAAANVGAVTWGDGQTAGTRLVGPVSDTNSLVGTTLNDRVGFTHAASHGVTALSNGNYVVRSTLWNGERGAVTWGNGLGGTVSAVSAANSLVGTTANDVVGIDGVTALSNGNYVVRSPYWDGAAADVGAVTWGDGSTAGTRLVGTVSAANSLVGTAFNDRLGSGDVTALSNGNYVVSSLNWDGFRGAVTWSNGAGGTVGAVSTTNSLVGTNSGDSIGSGGIRELSNGNFVVRSPFADTVEINEGLVHVVSPGGGGFTNPLIFSDNAAGTTTITPSQITAITNTGTAVVLQANNDITLAAASDIITNNTGGNGGALTMQAGRSIFLNSNITTDNGALTLSANDPGAISNRDAGNAVINIATGVTINTGTGALVMNLNGSPDAITNAGTLSMGGSSLISGLFNNNGTVNVSGLATLGAGKVWNNSGAVNISGAGLLDLGDTGPATFNNQVGGVVNIGTAAGWSFISIPSTQNGVINNAGTINVNSSTSWEAAFNNAASGTLNIATGQYVSMQNGQNIAGTVNIGAGGTLWVSEWHGTNTLFNGTTIGGTGTLQVIGGISPVAHLTNVSAPGITLLLGAGGTVRILNGASVFGALNVGASGGGFGITNGEFQQATGDLIVPSGAVYSGAVTYLSQVGNVIVPGLVNAAGSTITLNAGAGNLKVLGGGSVSGTNVHLLGGNVMVGEATSTAPASVQATTLLDIMTPGSFQLMGGVGTGASARVSSTGALTVSASGDVILAGGSGAGAFAHLRGDPNVVLASVGGMIRMDAGTGVGAYARIESVSPTTIYATFPNLASGGYFVNGVEGVVYDAATSTGFVAGTAPAILNTNLLITYGLTAGGGALAGALLEAPTQTLIVATGESITPPEPEKDKDIFEDIKSDKKDKPPLCK